MNQKEKAKHYGYRIGFKVECAIAVTAYKEQGRTEERLIMEVKDHAHVPGLWNVSVSRVKHPKHNHIPDGQWPTAMDIQQQRLNKFVIEAEIFEMVVKIQASKTLRRWTVGKDVSYGETWTMQECEIADFIGMAYQNKITTSVPSIRSFVEQRAGKVVAIEDIKSIIQKMDSTDERMLKELPPYLKDEEYKRLVDYGKSRQAPPKQFQKSKHYSTEGEISSNETITRLHTILRPICTRISEK